MAAPWLIRNEQLFGSPLLATESGETFLGSNNPYVVGDLALCTACGRSPNAIPEYRKAIEFDYNEVEHNQIQNQIAFYPLNPARGSLLAFCYKLERWLTPITVSGGLVRLLVIASFFAAAIPGDWLFSEDLSRIRGTPSCIDLVTADGGADRCTMRVT